MNRAEVRRAIELVADNRDALMLKWSEFHG
jgi:hypothetical protein